CWAAEAVGEGRGAGVSQCGGVCRRHTVQPGMTNDRFQYLSFINLSARRARTPGPPRARKRRTPGPGSPGPGVLAGREPSGADETRGEVALDLVQRHTLLLHGVALAHGHRVVVQRVE